MRAAFHFASGVLGLALLWGCSRGSLQRDGAPLPDAVALDGGFAADATQLNDTAPRPDVAPDVTDPAAPLTGRRSFVVRSTVGHAADAGTATLFPFVHTFTMVLDWDGRTAFVGAAGNGGTGGGIAPFQATPTGGAINQVLSFRLSNGATSAIYERIDITIDAAGALSGTGRGQATYQPPTSDVGSTTPAMMFLSGVPDTLSPSFIANLVGSAPIDPFTSLTVAASEPLPPDTRLAAVGLRGDRVALEPLDIQAPAAFSFAPSAFRIWRYSEQYTVTLGGVVDFAGNAAPQGTHITFTTAAPPPLVAEDGFESAAGDTLAGAQVLSGVSAATINGARSLYIPSLPEVFPPGRGDMTQLALRLALDPTDTTVRFSYRSVNAGAASIGAAVPYFLFGSEGTLIGYAMLGPDNGSPTTTTIPGQGDVVLGPVMTATLALPTGATGDVTLVRKVPACCGGLPAPRVPGLILDDLRTE
jgi:hypothetical protein